MVAVALMLHDYARTNVLGGPLPSPPLPQDPIQQTPVEELGKLMLYNSTLSNPPGYFLKILTDGYTKPNPASREKGL